MDESSSKLNLPGGEDKPKPNSPGNGVRKGRSASNPAKGKGPPGKGRGSTKKAKDDPSVPTSDLLSPAQLNQIASLIATAVARPDSRPDKRKACVSSRDSLYESDPATHDNRRRQRSKPNRDPVIRKNEAKRWSSPETNDRDTLQRGSSSEESGDSDVPEKKEKKPFDKKKQIRPPTDYWMGRSEELTNVGRIGGSREKFEDLRHEARREAEEIERFYKQKPPSSRWACSHLLLGYQLPESRRLLNAFLDVWDKISEQPSERLVALVLEANLILKHHKRALQIAVDATRHELAMADLLENHGPEMVEAMEGKAPKDPRYAA